MSNAEGVYMDGKVMNLDAAVAAAAVIREENARLCAEVDVLRGRLWESRRVCRQVRRECAEARARAARDEAYWHRLIAAAVAVSVALTCLLHSVILALA